MVNWPAARRPVNPSLKLITINQKNTKGKFLNRQLSCRKKCGLRHIRLAANNIILYEVSV